MPSSLVRVFFFWKEHRKIKFSLLFHLAILHHFVLVYSTKSVKIKLKVYGCSIKKKL